MSTYRVTHQTTYRYQSPVTSSFGQLCLLPRDFEGQRCTSSTVDIAPEPSDHRERVDYFGNRVAYFTVQEPHELLTIKASSDVEVNDDRVWSSAAAGTPVSTVASALADLAALRGEEHVDASNFVVNSPRVTVDDRVRAYAAPSFDKNRPMLDALSDLASRIHQDFGFDATTTTVTSTIDDLFEHGAGVCQDFAHLGVACLRSQGIPARYVSGYLETLPPPGQEKLIGADVSHAWVSGYVPGLGWVDVDPTNDQFVNGRYITTGWGRDYSDVSPLKGVVYSDGGTTTLDVSVDVRRLD